MLVLTRKVGEKIQAGNVTIEVLAIVGKRVRIGIIASREVPIVRSELIALEKYKRSEMPLVA